MNISVILLETIVVLVYFVSFQTSDGSAVIPHVALEAFTRYRQKKRADVKVQG